MKVPWRKAIISLNEQHVAEVAAEHSGEQQVYVWLVRRADEEDEVIQWGHAHSFEDALRAAQEMLRRLFRQSLGPSQRQTA